MLTQRHVAILLAALKFFDEEMTPHALDAARYYFENPEDTELAAEELLDLRRVLRMSELRYTGCDLTTQKLTSLDLMGELEARSNAGAYAMATIFLPKSV